VYGKITIKAGLGKGDRRGVPSTIKENREDHPNLSFRKKEKKFKVGRGKIVGKGYPKSYDLEVSCIRNRKKKPFKGLGVGTGSTKTTSQPPSAEVNGALISRRISGSEYARVMGCYGDLLTNGNGHTTKNCDRILRAKRGELCKGKSYINIRKHI